MSPFVGEFIGTAILIILGDGVVANVLLNKTKGNNSGLIVIALGWGMAVFVAVYVSAAASGAHLNPAVTIGLATAQKFSWGLVPLYLLAQLLGALAGAAIVWVIYRQHFNETVDAATKLAVFSTGPAIRSASNNFISESIASLIFILGVFFIASPTDGSGATFKLGALDALPVALLVLSIGLSLGGPTGYAINPARDLGPRIAHFILPMKNKGSSDWAYSWVPVLAPIVGAILAALIFTQLQN